MKVISPQSIQVKPYYYVYAIGGGFLFGIAVGNFFLPAIFFLYGLILGIIILFIIWQHTKWLLVVFFLLGSFFAFVRWQTIFSFGENNNIRQLVNKSEKLIIQVSAEPDIRADKQLLTTRVKLSTSDNWLHGRALITVPLYPQFQYGDIIAMQGELLIPTVFPDFNYERYLARHGIYAVAYYPEVILLESTNSAYKKLLNVKDILINKVGKMLPEPEASFLNGLLWGAKRAMFEPVLEKFNITGTTHVVALSGYNITILGLIIFFIAPWLGLGRKKAFWLALSIIGLFVLITGYPASVVRAAIMGIMVLVAYRWGGGIKPGILLIVSASLMCFINPFVFLWDAGFQLSFLATIGLIYVMPNLEKYFYWVPLKFGLRETVLATTSAIIMTTPLILFQFDRFSLVALPANILILFVIPLAMAVGFLAVLTSFIWFYLGQVIGWLAYLLLHYVIFITDFLSQVKYASLQVLLSLNMMILIYIVLFAILFYVNKKSSTRI